MAADYISYRTQISPPWFLTGAGPGWNTGLGSEENATALLATQCVEVRYPDYAPMDGPVATTSQALSYVENDRQLLAVYGDGTVSLSQAWQSTLSQAYGLATQPGLPATRQYLKSGFSQGDTGQSTAAGATRPWLPNQSVSTTDLVGAAGLVWACTGSGTTGAASPFGDVLSSTTGASALTASVGQVVTESTGVEWTCVGALSASWGAISPTYQVTGPAPSTQTLACPRSPGWYWAGTDQAFLDALVSAGVYTILSDGSILPPKIYHNADFVVAPVVTFGGTSTAQIVGSSPTALSIAVRYDPFNVRRVVVGYGAPAYAPGAQAVVGQFVTDSYGSTWQCVQPGVSGTTPAWPNPPIGTESVYDNGVVWAAATFQVAPTLVPLGLGAAALQLHIGFSLVAVNGTATYTPSPPDGDGSAWARIWLVIPAGPTQLVNRYWEPNGQPGAWQWGTAPTGQTTAVVWGLGVGQGLYGLVSLLAQRWLPGHVRLMGAWVVTGPQLTLDSLPAAPWNPAWDITINGIKPPYMQYS